MNDVRTIFFSVYVAGAVCICGVQISTEIIMYFFRNFSLIIIWEDLSKTLGDAGQALGWLWERLTKTWGRGGEIAPTTTRSQHIPKEPHPPKQPWITHSTWELIQQRSQAREESNTEEETRLNKEVRKQARKDKT